MPNVLNTIPSEFDLTEKELLTHNQCQDLFNILWKIKNDPTFPDSLQVKMLSELAKNDRSIPGCYATNLLLKNRALTYIEPVYLWDPLKSAPSIVKKHEPVIQTECLKVFPNPAGNYFIAQYDLTGKEGPGILAITDLSGKSLRSFQLKDKQNQVVITSTYFSQGSYLVNLIDRNNLVGSARLIITK
jgi:hypothetical protein